MLSQHPVSLFSGILFMNSVWELLKISLKWSLRDRAFHAILGTAVLALFFIPVFSTFSMRQVQEMSITLALSAVSLVLLVIATISGASSIWRDVEKKYIVSVLGLPISRTSYLLAKFFGNALTLLLCAVVLGAFSSLAIVVSSSQYPSEVPIRWMNIIAAVLTDSMKYVLLAAFGLLFSSLSTSFFLPLFGTVGIFLAGTASQSVYEYISGDYGKQMPKLFSIALKGLYYILPNFSAFDLKVQAIYGLPLSWSGIALTTIYFVVYSSALLFFAQWIFVRRQLG